MNPKANSSIIPNNTQPGSVIYLTDKFLHLWPDLRGLSLLTLGAIPQDFILQSSPHNHIQGNLAENLNELSNLENFPSVKTCCFTYNRFPFAKCSFDRIIFYPFFPIGIYNIHKTLRSCWEILKDDGKILLLLPNKLKWWGIFNLSNFFEYQKKSFYIYQLKKILKDHMFQLVYYEKIIYFPSKIMNSFSLYGNKLLEFLGHFFIPFGGEYHLIEIRKNLYAPITIFSASKKRILNQKLPKPNWNRKRKL